MLILRNFNKGNWLFFVSLFFYFSCVKKNSSETRININSEFDSTGKQLRLKLNFKSAEKDTFLFDRNVFSVFNSNLENENLLLGEITETSLVDKIKYSQCIVENKKHVKRFFSDVRLFENEEVQAKSVLMLDPNYDTISLAPNNEINVSTNYIDINRFKNDVSDSVVRVIYIFKPTSEQEKLGFRPKILTSNWFSVVSMPNK